MSKKADACLSDDSSDAKEIVPAGDLFDSTLTRRGFLAAFGVAAGSLLMPHLPGQGVVYAYAAEGGDVTFVIKVVKPNEIGLAAIDPSDNKRRLGGVTIAIKSLHNGKTLTGTTSNNPDELGEVVFDITELAEPKDDFGFHFSGSIKATKDGYRVFETGIMRLYGGSGAYIPTQPLDGKPYAQLITFDKWDIQYNSSSFMRSSANTRNHQVSVRLWVPNDGPVSIGYWEGEKKRDLVTKTATGNLVEATFSAQLLNTNSAQCLAKKALLSIWFRQGSGSWFKIRTHVEILDATSPSPSGGDQTLEPKIGGSGGEPGNFKFKLPKSFVKPFKEMEVDIWTPVFPFKYNFSPFGLFMLGIGTPDFEYSTGMDETKDWAFAERKTVKEQWGKQQSKWKEAKDNFANAREGRIDPKTNKQALFYSWDMFADLKATLGLAVMAYGEWPWVEGTDQWNAYLQAMAKAELEISTGTAFAVWIVPFFIEFKLTMKAVLTAEIGFKMRKLNFSSIEWDTSHIGVSVTFGVDFAITLACGVKGVASIGVRGWGYISFYVGFVPPEEPSDPLPHLRFDAGVGISWCVQVFIAKFSGVIISKEWKPLDGNWKKDKESGIPAWSDTDPDFLLNAPATDCPDPRTMYPEFLTSADDFSVPYTEGGDQGGDAFTTYDAGGNPQGFTLVTKEELRARAEFNASGTGETNYPAPAGEPDLASSFSAYEVDSDGDGVADCLYMWADSVLVDAVETDVHTYVKHPYSKVDGSPTFNFVNITGAGNGTTNEWDTARVDRLGIQTVGGSYTTAYDRYQAYLATPEGAAAYQASLATDGLTYTYCTPEGGGGVLDTAIGDTGVTDVGPDGIDPSMEVLICKDVFSDPRVKVISVDTTPPTLLLFRILPVKVGTDDARTRLTASCYLAEEKKWSKPTVIPFEYESHQATMRNCKNYRRYDTFDYEFDVVACKGRRAFRIALTSGKRAAGDDTTYEKLMKDSLFNFVQVSLGETSANGPALTTTKVHTYCPPLTNEVDSWYFLYSMPRIINAADGTSFFTVLCSMGYSIDSPTMKFSMPFINSISPTDVISASAQGTHGMDWLANIGSNVTDSQLVRMDPAGSVARVGWVITTTTTTYSAVLKASEITSIPAPLTPTSTDDDLEASAVGADAQPPVEGAASDEGTASDDGTQDPAGDVGRNADENPAGGVVAAATMAAGLTAMEQGDETTPIVGDPGIGSDTETPPGGQTGTTPLGEAPETPLAPLAGAESEGALSGQALVAAAAVGAEGSGQLGSSKHQWSNPLGTGRLEHFSTALNVALYTENDQLYGKSLLTGTASEVGPKGFKIKVFTASTSGKLLFFAKNYKGPTSPTVTPEGVVTEQSKESYMLYCSRLIDGKFLEAFPFATLERPIDSISHFDINNAAAGFIYSTVTDLKTSKADIYCTSIPYVKAISVLGFESEQPFVCAGVKCRYALTVRNDGNTVVEGFSIIVTQQGPRPFDPITIPIVPTVDSTKDGVENYAVTALDNKDYAAALAAGTLQVPTTGPGDPASYVGGDDVDFDSSGKAGVLIPGRPRTYYCYMTIPRGWTPSSSTTQGVAAAATATDDDVTALGEGELTAQAAQKCIVTVKVDPASINITTLPAGATPGVPFNGDDLLVNYRDDVDPTSIIAPDIASLALPNVSFSFGSDTTVDASSANASIVEDHGNNPPPGVRIPDMGDSNDTIGLAATALGLAGAGMAAYSKRRTTLSRERAGDEDGCDAANGDGGDGDDGGSNIAD